MAITIYQKLVKSFPPTWQHHRLIIASIIVFIILLPTVNGKANPRLDASLLHCTLRSARYRILADGWKLCRVSSVN
jgi:hypothetical protein